MRVWIDLANSPHVPLLEPVVRRLEADGDDVFLTARDHAQTVDLAQRLWPQITVIGGKSPPGRLAKARSIAGRAAQLRRFSRAARPDVAFSHGSYAQLLAAQTAAIAGVTMMDYEHQPANHLSFRLARRVIVPEAFPEAALWRFGARPPKVIRYPGFKEELYLAGFLPDPAVLDELKLDRSRVIAVFRPPPEGALYHRMANERFDEILRSALSQNGVEIVLLPRTQEQADRYLDLSSRIRIPERAIDANSLLALADVTVGAGGTMNRESALLGTPTYTVFAGQLAAVDAELVRLGRLRDLRDPASRVEFAKKEPERGARELKAAPILEAITATLRDAAARALGSRQRPRLPQRPS